jgi:hypothetical protein
VVEVEYVIAPEVIEKCLNMLVDVSVDQALTKGPKTQLGALALLVLSQQIEVERLRERLDG